MKNYVLSLSIFLSLFSFGNLRAETELSINHETIIVDGFENTGNSWMI